MARLRPAPDADEQRCADACRRKRVMIREGKMTIGTEVGVLVDKTSETMAAVYNCARFHGAGNEWRRTLPQTGPDGACRSC